MGYRELLKKYIRFVEAHAGDHFIDAIGYGAEPAFSDRELGELRAMVGDMSRTAVSEITYGRMPSFNYRLRLLSICYGLTPQQVADMAGTDAQMVRRWRTNPHSHRFIEMREDEFVRFECALFAWVSTRSRGAGGVARARPDERERTTRRHTFVIYRIQSPTGRASSVPTAARVC